LEDLFTKKMHCSVCDKNFESSKLRRSKYSVKSIDTDFNTMYKGENPQYYNVYICPYCGYGFTDNFKKPTEEAREEILHTVSPLSGDYSGQRTLDMAIKAFERALQCARIIKEKNQVLAGLTLHLAWFNREAGNAEKEQEYLQKALEYFILAYEREVEAGSLAKTLYLMGEISRRLGDQREAVRWFGRVINDKSIKDAGIIRMARERWQEMREDENGEI